MDTKAIARQLAAMGRGHDRVLAHINRDEAALLAKLGGGTVNPNTGLPEFGFWKNLGDSLTSDFNPHNVKELFTDPHKLWIDQHQNPVNAEKLSIAAKFIPVVGNYVSMADSAYYAHEKSTPGSPLYKGGYSNADKAATAGIAASDASAIGGKQTGAPASTAPSSGGNTAYLSAEIEQLKQELQQAYAQAGQADSPELAKSIQQLDSWHAAQQQAALQAQAQQQAAAQ